MRCWQSKPPVPVCHSNQTSLPDLSVSRWNRLVQAIPIPLEPECCIPACLWVNGGCVCSGLSRCSGLYIRRPRAPVGEFKLWLFRPVPLQWILHPTSQQLEAGSDLHLQAEARGAAPLHYQWLHEGHPLPGWQLPSITLNSATSHDGGSYACQVEDGNGQVSTSQTALIGISER